ncbi:transposase [Kitasatospora cathayae]|uniref:Transposase n=1 Tax=Kitasatospora cathayae TaxID=3004092 RepID=A0ABY7QHF1_9ACTN|nr:transposase [Kitasatospora sp. HUAS 3-15]WBP91901.1 transposase [Kitasatospora sp. HUAS 3-15]
MGAAGRRSVPCGGPSRSAATRACATRTAADEKMGRLTAAAEHSMSNGLAESMNTRVRLIARMAFGFKDPAALIALAMLSLGGHRPHLPGRQAE